MPHVLKLENLQACSRTIVTSPKAYLSRPLVMQPRTLMMRQAARMSTSLVPQRLRQIGFAPSVRAPASRAVFITSRQDCMLLHVVNSIAMATVAGFEAMDLGLPNLGQRILLGEPPASSSLHVTSGSLMAATFRLAQRLFEPTHHILMASIQSGSTNLFALMIVRGAGVVVVALGSSFATAGSALVSMPGRNQGLLMASTTALPLEASSPGCEHVMQGLAGLLPLHTGTMLLLQSVNQMLLSSAAAADLVTTTQVRASLRPPPAWLYVAVYTTLVAGSRTRASFLHSNGTSRFFHAQNIASKQGVCAVTCEAAPV
jgi:hypothetical protein